MNRDHDATFGDWNLWKNAATLTKFSKKCIFREILLLIFVGHMRIWENLANCCISFWNAKVAKFFVTLRKIFARQFFSVITSALGPNLSPLPPKSPTSQLSQYVPCLTLSFPYLSVTGTWYSIFMVKCIEPALCYASWKGRWTLTRQRILCWPLPLLFPYRFRSSISGWATVWTGWPAQSPSPISCGSQVCILRLFYAANIIKPF